MGPAAADSASVQRTRLAGDADRKLEGRADAGRFGRAGWNRGRNLASPGAGRPVRGTPHAFLHWQGRDALDRAMRGMGLACPRTPGRLRPPSELRPPDHRLPAARGPGETDPLGSDGLSGNFLPCDRSQRAVQRAAADRDAVEGFPFKLGALWRLALSGLHAI